MFRNITLVVFFGFFMAASSFASYPIYDQKKELDVSRDLYYRYVRPQLKNIFNEYFYLLKKLDPKNHSVIELNDEIESLNPNWEEWVKNCKTYEDDCPKNYKKLLSGLEKIDKIIFELQNEEIPTLENENHLQSLKRIDELYTLNFLVTQRIVNFKEDIFRFPHRLKKEKNLLLKEFNHMEILSEILLTKNLNHELKDDFSYVWTHFFKKIYNGIIIPNDKEFLLSRLEELNWAWNTFHMRVSKNKKGMDKGLLNTLKIMHSRWNSILKIILNT